MKKLLFIFGIIICILPNLSGQEITKKQIPDAKLMAIRSNSREITSIRKTNSHARHQYRDVKAINRDKRSQLRNNRAMMQRKKAMMQRKNQMMKRNQMNMKRTGRSRRR